MTLGIRHKTAFALVWVLLVACVAGCTESVVATDTPEFPPGLASALVDEKIISDLDTNISQANTYKEVVYACYVLRMYVLGQQNHLAEEYLGNGVWKVQLVDSTGKLVAGAFGFGPHEWNVFERTNTVARTSSADSRIC